MLMLLLSLPVSWAGLPVPAEPPRASVTYAPELLALDLGRLDDPLVDYGFTPVGPLPLLAQGVRGTLTFGDLWLGLNMRTATSVRGDEAAVPTVVNASWTGIYGAWTVVSMLRVGGDVGVAAQAASVGSTVQGGALVYVGPFVQPRITWRVLDGPGIVDVSGGWMLHTPLGSAHDNPLWEESFDRRLIQGLTLSVEVGVGTGGWQ